MKPETTPTVAAILCQETLFRRYAAAVLEGRIVNADASPLPLTPTLPPSTPEATVHFLRAECRILSRKELATNEGARRRFAALRTEYDAWRGKIGQPR